MSSKQAAVIFDIDGTLANITPILDIIGLPTNPDTAHKDKFFTTAHLAPVNGWVADIARDTFRQGNGVLVITARDEKYRVQTEAWLAINGIFHHELHMRADDDTRPDTDVKRDLYAKVSQRWNVRRAIDDNPDVLNLWESLNIDTTEVPGWTYGMGS